MLTQAIVPPLFFPQMFVDEKPNYSSSPFFAFFVYSKMFPLKQDIFCMVSLIRKWQSCFLDKRKVSLFLGKKSIFVFIEIFLVTED